MKRYSYPKLYCKKLSNQKPMANTVSTTRRTTWIATTSFPSRKFSALSSSILLNEDILMQLPFWFVSVHRTCLCDYFYPLLSHTRLTHRPVNDLSTAVKLTNQLLSFWADEAGFTVKEFTGHLF